MDNLANVGYLWGTMARWLVKRVLNGILVDNRRIIDWVWSKIEFYDLKPMIDRNVKGSYGKVGIFYQ